MMGVRLVHRAARRNGGAARPRGPVYDRWSRMGAPGQVVGRYQLFGEIASGGMATVHYGLMLGPAGFARTVAIKRLHAHLSKAPEFTAMIVCVPGISTGPPESPDWMISFEM